MSDMTDFEDLLASLKVAQHLANHANERVHELYRKIVPLCTHPAEHVEDRKWHHGYGKYITGDICNLCRSVRGWKGQGSWTSAADYSKYLTERANRDD